MRSLRLVVASWRDLGFWVTVDQLPLAPFAPLLNRRLKRRKLRQLAQDGFDETHGTDTAGMLIGRELGPATNKGGHLLARYETTRADVIRMALDSLAIDFSEFVFIDLGCGKGKPLLVAAGYSFRRLIGIDLSEVCIETTRRNIACYGPEPIDHTRIELAVQDVEDFVFPDCPMVIYLYNPFPPKLVAQIMARLELSLANDPRSVVIVYVDPAALGTVWRSPSFERVLTMADRMPAIAAGLGRYEQVAVFATRNAASQQKTSGVAAGS